MRQIEIPNNSNLEVIESHVFSRSSIEELVIPSKVTTISQTAFSVCDNLRIIEIPEESRPKSLPESFHECKKLIIMIPQLLNKLIIQSFNKMRNV